MKRFILITVVPVLVAFGAGVSVGSVLTSSADAPPHTSASGISPEAIHRSIDTRSLPETRVRDFN
jgi:hypothetical protein